MEAIITETVILMLLYLNMLVSHNALKINNNRLFVVVHTHYYRVLCITFHHSFLTKNIVEDVLGFEPV
jgi:hypothetical protein